EPPLSLREVPEYTGELFLPGFGGAEQAKETEKGAEDRRGNAVVEAVRRGFLHSDLVRPQESGERGDRPVNPTDGEGKGRGAGVQRLAAFGQPKTDDIKELVGDRKSDRDPSPAKAVRDVSVHRDDRPPFQILFTRLGQTAQIDGKQFLVPG